MANGIVVNLQQTIGGTPVAAILGTLTQYAGIARCTHCLLPDVTVKEKSAEMKRSSISTYHIVESSNIPYDAYTSLWFDKHKC